MIQKIYNKPFYYEIAFSFINIKKQIDLFEKFIKKYSKVKVKRVLDIACGPSLQLRELARRGYQGVGVDSNLKMLTYLKQKAKEEGLVIDTEKANMKYFDIKKKVDFAFIMMGSFKFRNNDELLNHLDSVANSLRKGGLYLIENLELNWPNFKPQSWAIKRNGVKIKTVYKVVLQNALSQTFKEEISLQVNDRGVKQTFKESEIIKYVCPQEFLLLLNLNKRFEFIGWFERFSLRKLKNACADNIVVLRKKI
ncbi:class I SAM-dependent methyltransferase [bacterium]|nr:MAG: class I SAM-dependent methyltransferase [bacterium]